MTIGSGGHPEDTSKGLWDGAHAGLANHGMLVPAQHFMLASRAIPRSLCSLLSHRVLSLARRKAYTMVECAHNTDP